MEFMLSGRSREQEKIEYLPLNEHGLHGSFECVDGDGSPSNPFIEKIQIKNGSGTSWSGVMHIELPFRQTNPRFFLPAFMYGRNRGESPQEVATEFPRIRQERQRPSSPDWMVRSDRLSHPTALVYDSGRITGFSASPYFINSSGVRRQWLPGLTGTFDQYAGFTCSIQKGTLGYTLGYENAPWLFVQARDVRDRAPLDNNCFELAAGETIEFTLERYDIAANSELDINDVIQTVYYRYHESPRKVSNPKTAVDDLSRAVYEDAWLPDVSNYCGQVFDEANNGVYRYNPITSISWVNGVAVATPQLMAALRVGNESMREQAIACISNIVENSLNPVSGLPFEYYENGKWTIKGWWFDGMHNPGHSSYIIGQAMYYILKAYEYEMRFKNCLHMDWLEFVKTVLLRIEKTKNSDNEYPFILSEKTGAGIEYNALSGVWCMAALAYYCRLTGEKTDIDGFRKSEQHYYETFVKPMECYGGPLDTNKATDSEGILAYIKAVRHLHTLTGEAQYLIHMRDALCYEFSFKFCYNSPIKVPPLDKIGWSSCGGSVTSIANPHIHPMSSNLVDELLYYVEQTNDTYVRDRMQDTIAWGCQSYNTYDGEYDYGKIGWMSERFCHSQGLVAQKYPDGSLASTWFCLMPWASASILDGLAGDVWDRHNIFS